jgi:hypothetical protein
MQKDFNFNLSRVLAHSIVYWAKESYSPDGIVDDVVAQGDNAAPTPGESTAATLQAYIQNLPQLLNVTAAQTLPVGQTTQQAQNVLAPEQQALQTQMAQQDLPGLTQLGNQLNQLQTAGGIANANTNLTGAGGQLAQNTAALQQQLDPQYYATRASEGTALNNVLNQLGGGSNPVGVNGSDIANINRGLAQQDAQKGLLNAPSQTAAVSNAMQFGQQGENLQAQKTNTLSQAINSATSFLPSSQGQVNAFNVGTGAASNQSASPGTSNFLGTTGTTGSQNASSSNSSSGNNLLSGITSLQNTGQQINSNMRSPLDMVTQTLGSLPNIS